MLKRDWVIWCGCFGLFLAGGIYFNMLPEIVWKKEVGVADLVGGVSAIAAAIAAFAAWRAASIANKQSTDSAASIRWQMYKMHVESFNEWVKGIESDQKVTFYRKQELYEVIFPSNRDPSRIFTDKGSPEVAAWQSGYAKLAEFACTSRRLSSREVSTWVGSYMMLTSHIKYSALSPNKKQFFMDDRIASGISLDNYENVLPVMCDVVNRLSRFAFVETKYGYAGMSTEFKESFKAFFMDVMTNGYDQHSYREDP